MERERERERERDGNIRRKKNLPHPTLRSRIAGVAVSVHDAADTPSPRQHGGDGGQVEAGDESRAHKRGMRFCEICVGALG